ncbi:phosphoglycerate mutase-like protein [Guyanagaster necrorhizus]|uniref:Phosphoglycerate mutase-like protein n=1 Tax=Guyanagaster necrorhizus TaxID=856835 RepID=A0A9P8AQU1_9AGAR|nr:phosphoglycerate mutase-like protein [Guyanagaster necrorhizus MCA 3950]KAG7444365.1 phosphoglycerate mutase-like protein [Guyanagaster necrorhizus MCA 3950]
MPSFTAFALSLFFVSVAHGIPFNPLHHSGPASPYFDAPSQFGISKETPEGCVVDQAAYILRHGSRYPEPGSYTGWQDLYNKFQNHTYSARGPLKFISSWVPPIDDEDHQPLYLSSTGAGEAFALGVDLRKRYKFTPGGENFTAWSAGQQRCVDTTTYFLRGYLSQGNYINDTNSNRGYIVTLPDSVNDTYADSLTTSASCPAYSNASNGSAISTAYRALYQSTMAERLNQFLEGDLVLDATDVGVMGDLCGFLYEVSGDRRFCDVFEESEWLDYEYAHDLNYYYGSGPGNALSATVGYSWVKAISDLFEVGPNNTVEGGTVVPPPLIMGFTHDNNLPPIISALGLWNTSNSGIYPLSKTQRRPDRMFRSSYLVAFRGYVALERLACSTGNSSDTVYHVANQTTATGHESVYVRVRVNSAPVPIPGCAYGPGSMCPLDHFVSYVNVDMKAVAGDFGERCGLEESVDTLQFLTQDSDSYGHQIVSI